MLNQAQVEQYHEDGFLMLEGYFSQEDMDLLLKVARADQALAENANDRLDAEGRTSRLSLRFDLLASAYSAYVRHRGIVESMEQLLGEEVFHYHHKMMLKEPRVGGAWEWHQDYGYWYANFLKADMASCMIAVDRASRENGCLQVLKASHKLGRIEHGRTGDQTGADMERVKVALEHLEVVHCTMEPGTALFFHSNLLHRSDPNESEYSRWALICCYSAASNPTFAREAKAGHYEPLERWSGEEVREATERHWGELQSV
jgi:ectoine hydroxylase-related dioxygenase (phytanoyl-CoA dioxygenase family)